MRTLGSERQTRSLEVQSTSEIAAADALRLANMLMFCMSNMSDMLSKLYLHRRKTQMDYNPRMC